MMMGQLVCIRQYGVDPTLVSLAAVDPKKLGY